MGVHIENSELLITARHKTFHLDLPKYVSNNLKYKIDSIMKQYEFFAQHKIENKSRQLLPKYKHWNDIHEYGKQ